MTLDTVANAVRGSLTPELLKPEHRGSEKPYAGHCYVATEAYWHLMGWVDCVPQVVRHEGGTHWYLKREGTGEIVDLTSEQFETPVPYEQGRGCGFLTRGPSKRARVVIDRVIERYVNGEL